LSDLGDWADADASTPLSISQLHLSDVRRCVILSDPDALRSVTSTVLVSGDGARVVNDAGKRARLISELRGSKQKD
jgi:hypothetical protein